MSVFDGSCAGPCARRVARGSVAVSTAIVCGLVVLLGTAQARAQTPLEEHSAAVLVGTRGTSFVLDARAVLGGEGAQPFVATRIAADTYTVDGLVGLQAHPWRSDVFRLRVAGATGPSISARDGLAAGGRLVLELQGEAHLGDVVFAAGPKFDGALIIDLGATPKLATLGTLAVGWQPAGSLGVFLILEGGPSFTARGNGLLGSALVGVVLPLPHR